MGGSRLYTKYVGLAGAYAQGRGGRDQDVGSNGQLATERSREEDQLQSETAGEGLCVPWDKQAAVWCEAGAWRLANSGSSSKGIGMTLETAAKEGAADK
jgi:hypothetical protein